MNKIFFLAFLFSSFSWSQELAPSLPALSVQDVTVSGISSGAFMAVQLGMTWPEYIKGVASFAGGIYFCAEGNASQAQGLCMKSPEDIDVDKYVQTAKTWAREGKIGNLATIATEKVFIFQGTSDSVIDVASSSKLNRFYQALGVNPALKIDTPAGHGFPSIHGSWSCGQSTFPYLVNCRIDGAKEVLEYFYGTLAAAGVYEHARLTKFRQLEFGDERSSLASDGYIYIPDSCRQGGCRLHIALHGCVQSPLYVQENFVGKAGFNEWAETNRIVVLYPSVQAGVGNPMACWDWFGYSGANYAQKDAVQITSLVKMIQRLSLKEEK